MLMYYMSAMKPNDKTTPVTCISLRLLVLSSELFILSSLCLMVTLGTVALLGWAGSSISRSFQIPPLASASDGGSDFSSRG